MIQNRKKEIFHVSILGILINVILVFIKLIVGILSHSLAIILDALNNLGDALSAVLTIIGTKIAGLPPSRQHPFGYGRVEYLISIAIAGIIFLTGLGALRESILKIITPVKLDYSVLTIFVISLALITKFFFGRYCRKKGKELNAQSLKASGEDALTDAYISAGTLFSVAVFFIFRLNIDSYIGILISILILKTAFDILKETLGSIIGVRANSELIENIENTVEETDDEVHGVYDLILHDYGPDEMIGSVHIEVDDSLTASEIDRITRKISEKIYNQYSVILTIGIYAANNSDPQIIEIKNRIQKILLNYPAVEQMHGFYVDKVRKIISFDLIIHFEITEYQNLIKNIEDELETYYPDYSYDIIRDFDFE